jgi:hypothetical protein
MLAPIAASGSRSNALLLPLAVCAVPACDDRPSAPLKPPSTAPILLFGGALGICAGAFLAGHSTNHASLGLANKRIVCLGPRAVSPGDR